MLKAFSCMYLLVIHICSSCFRTGLSFYSCLLNCMNYLYILDSNPFSDLYVIFSSQSMACVLMVALQILNTLMKFDLKMFYVFSLPTQRLKKIIAIGYLSNVL